ncbi:hypothetical protein ACIOD2_41315 [Amycolatopsis sp. NPDC088138]|uniref:nSTAND1 domain-containing NTPase n=1 Tax=Amycolatopsis sp. NPDC088138 TaxID=3363938 RepID=UPI0037FCDD4D
MPRQERPLAESDDKLTQFAAGLRRLRDKAGKPTYRELSTRAHYSTSVLSDAAGGRRLPSLAVTLAFVRACEGDVEEWERRWREAAEERHAVPETAGDTTAPYAGLAAFEIADAGRFFGRDALVAELVQQVGERRFLGVFGASGTGKSSLLRAGMAAKLAPRPVVVLVPGAHPFEACAAALSALSGEPAERVRADLEAAPENLHTHVLRALANEPDDGDLVFVVDQFEETFTQCEDPGERDRFVAALVSAAEAGGSRIRVVLGIRADFYGRCGQYPLLVAALKDAQVMVGAMTTEELRQAVVRPAAAADLSVESALVSRVIADTAGQPAVLPLVSHALLETWRRRSGMTLTLAGYEKSGGIQHALARSAEDVYAGLDETQRAAARNLFLRLVVVGDSTEDSRRRLRPNELESLGPASGVVLDRFVRARLLTVGRHGVELAHEALIRHWPRLRDWLGEDREGLRVHRQLTEAALDWQRLGRDKEALYRGIRLQAARDWLAGNEQAATPAERAFLDLSSAADRRRLRRSRQIIAVLCVLVLVAATTTVVALKAQRTAADQRNVAVALNIVSRADSLQSTDPVLAAQLRLSAYRLAANADTAGSLLSAFSTPYAGRLDGHGGPVVTTAVSADGRLLATGSEDKTARLWDFSSPEHPRELAKIGQEDGVASLAISPDGRFLATVGDLSGRTQLWTIADPADPALVATVDGEGVTWTGSILTTRNTGLFGAGDQVTLWNVADPRKPVRLASIPGNGLPVFSPDRRLLAVAPAAGGALLWDVSDPAGPRPLEAPAADPEQLKSVAISVDGKTLATGNGEAIRLWDISDPVHRKELTLLPGKGGTAAFGPDGHSLITWSQAEEPRLWDIGDLAHPREVRVLKFNEGLVDSVSFSRDGRWAVIAGDEVRLVDLAGFTLDGMRGEMPSVEFSGETLIAGADAKNVKFWDVSDSAHPAAAAGSLPMPPKTDVAGVTRSQDGRTAAVQGMSGSTYLWDMTTRPPRQAAVLTGTGLGTTFSADGQLLATDFPMEALEDDPLLLDPDLDTDPEAGLAGLVSDRTQLWNVTDVDHPSRLGVLPNTGGVITSRAFANHGTTLAIATHVGVVSLWDVTDPHLPKQGPTLSGQGGAVAAGPGDLLAFAGADGTAQLWSLTDPHPIATLTGHKGDISNLAFSADGRLLATGGNDGTIRLWATDDPGAPRLLGALTGHSGPISGIAFSPDGRTVVTSSDDKTIRLWETDPERVAERICHTAYPRLSEKD